MNDLLYTCDITRQDNNKTTAINALENSRVLYFPNYAFQLQDHEQALLSESILNKKHKNISYDYTNNRLAGVATPSANVNMQAFMHRFAKYSKELLDTIIPEYTNNVIWGRTSYRPTEVRGRISSKRRDDTRVHVDSFAATPVNGLRLLRIFCNINPYGEPRVWNIGETFPELIKKFAHKIPTYNRTQAKLLNLIKITKTLRSPYDHYMLKLHDTMKLDDHYQENLTKKRIEFPAQSTWIVFTDSVSHAALSGQYLLEQTFYLPINAMQNPNLSPLKLIAQSRPPYTEVATK